MADREKVMTALEICASGTCKGCPMFGVDKCIDVLMYDALELLKEQEPQWVSVKDRLPKKRGEYIASDGERVFGACYEIGRSSTKWTGIYEGYCDFDVTHWMPLPEPPTEGA